MSTKFLPSGDELKNLLSQTRCTPGSINNVLRSRGVFCPSSDKTNTIPCLMKAFLSPCESLALMESIKTSEKLDRVNFRNFSMDQDTEILDVISGVIDEEALRTPPFENYRITDFTDFSLETNDSIDSYVLSFEIQREDILDDWHESTKVFRGSVEIKKQSEHGDLLLNIQLNHTTPETKKVANQFVERIEKELVAKSVIQESQNGGRVLFDSFENENRVKFLEDLSSQHTGLFEFYYEKLDDVSFVPDKDKAEFENFIKDANILEKDIEQYRFSGDLKKIISHKWKKIHPYIKVTKFVASYDVSYKTYKGRCKISYEFSEYNKRKLENPEFGINILKLTLKGATSRDIDYVQNKILHAIELKKTELVKKYQKKEVEQELPATVD
ncbi:GapS4b family protein [Vibrio jasicida]|uniref:GapS4b family protein n=1 Tax=Vibrio jasicida TaxID=766224 RepID=UPI0040676348